MTKLKIEIARSPSELAKGLMYRESLDQNSGMLFKFNQPTPISFWGKNTYIPLDVAFVKNDRITEIRHIVPMSCRLIHSSDICDAAIEANAGFFKQNNIIPGSMIKIMKDNDGKESEIYF